MTTSTGTFETEITSLSPEILLKIFLNLESHETVILRSVCKEFLEVIDNNKSLWKILEWNQQEEEPPIQALEMFDEKSASTLKEVSIYQREGAVDDERLVKVLHQSKGSLKYLSLSLKFPQNCSHAVIELASGAPLLESLILWCSQEYWLSRFPRTRLTRISRHPHFDNKRSNNLQVLWCHELGMDWNEKLYVSSLVSFADPVYHAPRQFRSFISNFSTRLMHLSIHSGNDSTTPSLSCPSLRVLECRFSYGFPSWLDAPNLQIVIGMNINPTSLQQIPISVEELWLLSWHTALTAAERSLDFLSQVCPQLKILKIGTGLFWERSEFKTKYILETFKVREAKVQEGVEIGGIKMVSVEKLILPIELLNSAQIDQLRDIVGEVIGSKNYPDFVELKY